MLKCFFTALTTFSLSVFAAVADDAADIVFDVPDTETSMLVAECLETEGVSFFEESRSICYNSAIFPEQFLKLKDLPPAERIIITSPGGNVATARVMSTILDDRGEPAIIAGPCMSACAMVLLSGLDNIHIHHSAHIAVHGITMMDYRTWWGWLKDDREPTTMALMAAQMGYDFGFVMHSSGTDHMEKHLEGQDVDLAYIQTISDQMLEDARAEPCRVDPKDYWGMLDASHLQTYLGDRLTRMERFAQSWDDPGNAYYKDVTHPISDQTYIFKRDYEDRTCP